MAGADLSCADLTLADLGCANLARATLAGSNLTLVDLTLADLTGADLIEAALDGADLVDCPRSLAASDLGVQRVEALPPRRAVCRQRRVGCAETFGSQRVEAPGAVGSHGDEALIAQDAQLAGYRGLGDAELRRCGRRQFACGALARNQLVEDAAADGIAEDVEGVHENSI